MSFRIFADGSSLGNPGPAGLGVVIYQGKEIVKEVSLSLGRTTNNVAEYSALIAALAEALAFKGEAGEFAGHIYMDSNLVVSQIKGKFKVKNPALKPFYSLAKHLFGLLPKCELSFCYREDNSLADKLAKEAAGKGGIKPYQLRLK